MNDGSITFLEIGNTKTGKTVYRMEKDVYIDEAKYNVLKARCKEKGEDLGAILTQYGKGKGCELTVREWMEIMKRLDA